jgi:peptide/nickel transport system permease protein
MPTDTNSGQNRDREMQDVVLDEELQQQGLEEQEVLTASQWRLMWWKFRKHKLALWAAWFLFLLYAVAALCDFLAPYPLDYRNIDYAYAPPQPIRFVSDEGLHLRPFVYALEGARHPETLRKFYFEDREQRLPIRFFVRGEPYRFWGTFSTDLHFFGVEGTQPVFLLGSDSLGRDLLSRILYGARISLTIGLIGVTMSFFLGLTIGAISGYYGGWIDHGIQRLIEILQSFPAIPLWMALAAALPNTWSPIQLYLGITVVLSLISWTGLARQVRGKILSLREEDFATAAILSGASQARVMWRHLLPSFMSHIIVALTLAVPAMILAETALSFLGLGLRSPVTSWGVLLTEAQNVQAVAVHPWLLTPMFFVIATVLAFNFLGDGLRDAADPYSR